MNINNVKKLNEKNAYLIGSKPEVMKMDIILFKEEVLIELKQLNNSLAEKYRKTDQEVKDKLELFDKKLNDCKIKLSELSSKIVTDLKSQEKLAELLIFKDKAQDIMTSNRVRLHMLTEETHRSIDRIDSLLKESILYPGVIGNNSKFKCFHEFIDYTLLQIALMNNFKEKNTMDLSSYKKRIEDLFNSMKIQMDNDIRAINYYSTDIMRKLEKQLAKELGIRDDHIREMRIGNQEYIIKLNEEVKEFMDEFNLIKKIKNDMDEELKTTKKNNIDYINDKFKIFNEKYYRIENQVAELNHNIKKTVNYLNKEDGANIELVQNEEFLSPFHGSEILRKGRERKSTFFRNKSNFDIISENIYKVESMNSEKKNNSSLKIKNKDKDSNKEEMNGRIVESAKERVKNKAGQLEENKNQKEKPKSSRRYQSDIMKYIKGEIKANEIGSMTKYHHSKNPMVKNDSEINQIKGNLIKNELRKRKSKTFINRNNRGLIYDINKVFDNSFENKKSAKKEKKITKNSSNYNFKKLIGIELNDIDVKYHGDKNNISNTFEYKNIKTYEDNNNIWIKSKNDNSFKNKLGNIDLNSKKSNINLKKNFFQKNLTLLSSEKIDNKNINIQQRMNNSGSYRNIFKYNNNSLINLFLPLRNKNQLKFNDKYNLNMFNVNKTIDNKVYRSPNLKLNKVSNNLFPLEINNNNSKFQNKNYLTSFDLNKNRIINNIKTLFNNKTYYS